MIELLKNWPIDEAVPAISLRQPWATAVAAFAKDVENRSSWPFKHRGPLIIQASATKPYRSDFELFFELAREDGATDEDLADISPESYPLNLFPHGRIIAVVNLAEVLKRDDDVPEDHPANASPWGDNEANYWLYFSEVVPVISVEYKGVFETVGNVLEEYETENDVLVLGSVHVAAELVSSEPELGFEADIGGAVVRRFARFRARHWGGT